MDTTKYVKDDIHSVQSGINLNLPYLRFNKIYSDIFIMAQKQCAHIHYKNALKHRVIMIRFVFVLMPILN